MLLCPALCTDNPHIPSLSVSVTATANLQDDAGGLKLKHDARGAPVGMDTFQKCLPHFRKQTLIMCYILLLQLYNILVKILFGWQPLKITGYAGFPHQFSTRFPRHCVHVQHGCWPQLSGPFWYPKVVILWKILEMSRMFWICSAKKTRSCQGTLKVWQIPHVKSC